MDENDIRRINMCFEKIESIKEMLNEIAPIPHSDTRVHPVQFRPFMQELKSVLSAKQSWEGAEVMRLVVECLELHFPIIFARNKIKIKNEEV